MQKQIEKINKLFTTFYGMEKGYTTQGNEKITKLLNEFGYEVSDNLVTNYKISVTENWNLQFKFCKKMPDLISIGDFKVAFKEFLSNIPTEFLFENLTAKTATELGFMKMNTATEEDFEIYKKDYENHEFCFLSNPEKITMDNVYHIPTWYMSLIPEGTELFFPTTNFPRRNGNIVFFAVKYGKHTGTFNCDVKFGTLFHGIKIA